MSEKIYRVQMNSKGMPNFSTAKEVPSADRPSGEWKCSDNLWEYAICSNCKTDTGEPYKHVKRHWSYCPHCGAKMKGADDE